MSELQPIVPNQSKVNLLGLTRAELEQFFVEIGENPPERPGTVRKPGTASSSLRGLFHSGRRC